MDGESGRGNADAPPLFIGAEYPSTKNLKRLAVSMFGRILLTSKGLRYLLSVSEHQISKLLLLFVEGVVALQSGGLSYENMSETLHTVFNLTGRPIYHGQHIVSSILLGPESPTF